MSRIRDHITHLNVSVGDTYRGDCPLCHGKNTFTVTNDSGNVMYNCYKASCDLSGAVHQNMNVHTIKQRLENRRRNTTESNTQGLGETFDLPPYISRMKPDHPSVHGFLRTWNINPDDVFYDIRQDRVVFPVIHDKCMYDAVGRSVFNRQPKWLRYASSQVPYIHGHGDVMVVVEDAISAYTVGEMFPNTVGVALLGTQLTEFHKWFLSTYYRYNSFIVALDHDAFNKTIKIVKDLRPFVNNVRGLKLVDDLKYLRSNDVQSLKEMLHGYN